MEPLERSVGETPQGASRASSIGHREWVRAYEPVTREYDDVALRVVEGALPAELRGGVLYRNGPGRMELGSDLYGHPFDGDGMVTRFAFGEDGVARYRNRYVRTREFLEEERAGRVLYRNFGTNRPGGVRRNAFSMRFKNAANTSVVVHGGALLALWEGGVPHSLDPDTLTTLERFDYQGQLRNRGNRVERWLTPELPFSAHPRRDPATGELFNFGMALGSRPTLMLYRVTPEGRMDTPQAVPVDAMFFAHDFVLTENYRVFFLCPVAFDIARVLLGTGTAVESIRSVRSRKTRVLLVPRKGAPTPVLAGETDACFIFHHVNAYEDARGRVIVDSVRMSDYPELVGIRELRAGKKARHVDLALTRFEVDPFAHRVTETKLSSHVMELPTHNPAYSTRAHRYAYAIANAPSNKEPWFTGIAKVDTGSRTTAFRELGPCLPGEAVFAARGDGAGGEDDGYVLTLAYVPEHHRSDLFVLDARDLRTVCRLALPHHVPPGFHGTFVPGALK